MKKLLSMLLTVCMLGAFAVSAAQAPTGYTVNFTEKASTVEADIICAGTMADVAQFNVWIKYDTTKLEFASESLAKEISDNVTAGKWGISDKKTKAGYQRLSYANITNPPVYVSGTDLKIATLTFNKLGTVSAADISVADSVTPEGSRKAAPTGYQLSTDTSLKALAATANFTAYKPASTKPTVTFNEPTTGIATYTKTAETDTSVSYTVTVKAPIGKVAALEINGVSTPLADGSYSATATENTTINVVYTDATETVITYTEVYKDGDVSVVFGKAPADATDYGFILDGAWKTFNTEVGTDIKAADGGKFAAKNAVNGVFAVQFDFNGKAEGSYSAKAYAGETEAANSVVIK